jgi:excisionase family DNA binding protein
MTAIGELVQLVRDLIAQVARLEKALSKPPRTAWRPREVADQTGISYNEILGLIKSGALGSVPVGRLYVVPDAELKRFLSTGIREAA